MLNPINLQRLFPDGAAQKRAAKAQKLAAKAASDRASERMAIQGLNDLPPDQALSVLCDYAATLPKDDLTEIEKARDFFCDLAWERGRE